MANVLFKVMTAEQYAAATKEAGTFYRVGNDLYLGSTKLSNGQDLLNALYANRIEYTAASGEDPAVSVKDALDDLYAAIGEGGGVSEQIQEAIEALDANVSQTAGADGLALSVTQVNGVITGVSGSIANEVYDSYGSASDVQDAITGDASTDTASSLTLNGLSKKAAAAQSAADAAQADADALETLVGTGYGENVTVKQYIDNEIAGVEGDATALESRVAANESAITLLNKTDGTVGSVKKTVDDAIAAVVAGAPEDFDTLKEMSDWIAGHEQDASAMNSAIQANKTAIGNASQEASGDDPAVPATGLHKKIEDETTRATTAEGGLNTRVTALEQNAGTGSVPEQIAAAVNALDAVVEIQDTAGTNPLNIEITQVDGVLTGVVGSIDAGTFDEAGAAATAKSEVIGDASTDTAASSTIAGAKKYADSLATNYDPAGSASTMGTTLVGASTDAPTANTIHAAKNYADNAVSAALTWEVVE